MHSKWAPASCRRAVSCSLFLPSLTLCGSRPVLRRLDLSLNLVSSSFCLLLGRTKVVEEGAVRVVELGPARRLGRGRRREGEFFCSRVAVDCAFSLGLLSVPRSVVLGGMGCATYAFSCLLSIFVLGLILMSPLSTLPLQRWSSLATRGGTRKTSLSLRRDRDRHSVHRVSSKGWVKLYHITPC